MPALTPNQWHEISPYLDHALSLPPPERVTWLEALRAETPEVTGLLEQLLDEHRVLSEEGFLEHGPVGALGERSLAGSGLAPYTLLSPIGQGGMGRVWLGERSDGRFDRQLPLSC